MTALRGGLALLTLAAATRARAAPGVEPTGGVDLRVILTVPTDFVVDSEGSTTGWGPALDTRARLGGGLHWGEALRLDGELDLFSGGVAGRRWDLDPLDERGRHLHDAASLAGVVPRLARVGTRLPWLDLELGLTTSAWGLGIVANDGAEDPHFGRSDFGDRTLRARLATAPIPGAGDERFPLFVIAAGDRVVADDLARWSEGDEAWQAVLALLYAGDREMLGAARPRRIGVYGVYRTQLGDDRRTEVGVADGYAEWAAPVGDAAVVRAGVEGAWIFGTTEAARTYDAPDGVAIRQHGLAAELSVATPDDRLGLHLRGVVGSGDTAPDDGSVDNFRFDRDYNVGMVLFDELLGAVELTAYHQASDPGVAAHPPDGAELLVAEGAITQAAALQPVLIAAPLQALELRVGMVAAVSTGPIQQAFETFRAGGVPTNHTGQPTSGRYLGTELDYGVASRAQAVEGWRVRPQLGVMVGHAWPTVDVSGVVRRVDHLQVVGRVGF